MNTKDIIDAVQNKDYLTFSELVSAELDRRAEEAVASRVSEVFKNDMDESVDPEEDDSNIKKNKKKGKSDDEEDEVGLKEVAAPVSPADKEFVGKHKAELKNPARYPESQFKADNVKKDKTKKAGYHDDKDKEVYS
jgi:hypothetical protein